MVHVIQNKADLNEKLGEAADRLVVINFSATWCGPCKVVGPIVEQLAAKYADKALVVKVDIDENEDIAMDYQVTCMPTFVFIKNMRVVEVVVGGNSEKLVMSFQKFTAEQVIDQPQTLPNLNQPMEVQSSEDGARQQTNYEPASEQLAVDNNLNENPTNSIANDAATLADD